MLTKKQQAVLELKQQGLSQNKIAEKLGISRRAVRQHIAAVQLKKTKHPNNPFFNVDKVSELIDNRTGESIMTWYKSSKEAELLQEVTESIISRIHSELPALPTVKKPDHNPVNIDILNVYYLGDPHMNMLSWARETGKDWDIAIALKHHEAAMVNMIARAPDAREGVLCTLGDMFHHDSLKAVTPASGNVVDVDGRLMKGWDATMLMIERFLQMMLSKYQTVHYICVPGNHSETLERIFASALRMMFRDNDRIVIHDNVKKHIPFTWGKNFILATHGDKLNNQKKADIAVSMFREQHGKAKFTHVVSGHVHHSEQKELSGVLVETLSVLAPPDAWHAESGYVTARQAAHQVTYHRSGGIYTRSETNPRIFLP